MATVTSDRLLAELKTLHPILIDLSLGRIAVLLEKLGNPHQKLPPVVHIAGTNGKGSTTAFLKAMFEAAGKRVHVYTSPHLVRFHERISLAGADGKSVPISEPALVALLQRVAKINAGAPVTFFEIDPLVIRLARDVRKFRFLSDCAPQARFVTGDARLTLASTPGANDIIVVDAFSSDAIPVHLLTREAFSLYVSKLAPEGLIAIHISNNTMEFSGIVARIAADLGLAAYMRRDEAVAPDDPEFRSAFLAYLEWGTRIAVINSKESETTEAIDAPMPAWGWGVPGGPYISGN